MSRYPTKTRLAREERIVAQSATALKFWSESPDRYSYGAKGSITDENRKRLTELQAAEVKINASTDRTARIISGVLPNIIKLRRPRTLEFISNSYWRNKRDEIALLQGVILRDANETVLLFDFGVGLADTSSELHRSRIFDLFGIPVQERRRIQNIPLRNQPYSVVVSLP